MTINFMILTWCLIVVNFSHFNLLLQNFWVKWNKGVNIH